MIQSTDEFVSMNYTTTLTLTHFYLINSPAGEGDQTYSSWIIRDSSFYLQYCFVPNAFKKLVNWNKQKF